MMFLLPSSHTDTSGVSLTAVEIKIEHDGRVFLPLDLRQRLEVQPGDTMLVDVTDDGMLLWTRRIAANGLQALVAGVVPPTTSLVSELRLMRRHESDTTSTRPNAQAPRSARGRA